MAYKQIKSIKLVNDFSNDDQLISVYGTVAATVNIKYLCGHLLFFELILVSLGESLSSRLSESLLVCRREPHQQQPKPSGVKSTELSFKNIKKINLICLYR